MMMMMKYDNVPNDIAALQIALQRSISTNVKYLADDWFEFQSSIPIPVHNTNQNINILVKPIGNEEYIINDGGVLLYKYPIVETWHFKRQREAICPEYNLVINKDTIYAQVNANVVHRVYAARTGCMNLVYGLYMLYSLVNLKKLTNEI